MIRFTSPAAGDVVMFDDQARALIELMGHLWSPRGAVAADDVPAALATLRAGVAQAEPAPKRKDEDDADEKEEPVGLQRRAWPLIELLQKAAAKHAPVLWER